MTLLVWLACTAVADAPAPAVADAPAPAVADAPTPAVVEAPPRGGQRRGPPEDVSGVPVDARIKNPVSGVELAVYEDFPSEPKSGALVVMPGGILPGALQSAAFVGELTGRGWAVFRFDPDGRGNSGGTEDKGGAVHQAGLRALIAHALAHPRVDPAKVGVVSYSYGITAASRVLAQDNPGARFLIDWEGPASRNWTRCGLEAFPSCTDETWWASREASRSIAGVRVPYLRVQSVWDHVHHEDRGSALEMVRAALAGGVPYVRLNDNPANTPAEALASVELPSLRDKPLLHEAIAVWADDLVAVNAGKTPPPHAFGIGLAEGPRPRRR